jgi:Tol biopolymer transport system component
VTRNLLTTDGGTENGSPETIRTCSTSQAFGAPTLVPGLNDDGTGAVVSARFSPDELTAYLSRYYGMQEDVYVATRAHRSDAFGEAKAISELNMPSEEDSPTVTADGLTLYMTSTRAVQYRLFVAQRATPTSTFTTPMDLGTLNVIGEGAPYVVPDGSALYFHTFRNGKPDIYRARQNATGFDPPESVSINTSAFEALPVVSADELIIYFYREGDTTGVDGVWMATRTSVADPFGPAVSLAALNDPYPKAAPTWISPDGCRLYLQEVDPQNGAWAYVAERLP